MSDRQAGRSPSLWRDRSFNIFWTGQTLSSLGDGFAEIAIPLLILQSTGSIVAMGLNSGFFGLGRLLTSVLAGPYVERADRRRLMIVCDLLRTVVYGAIPLCWFVAGPRLWFLYVTAGLAAALGMLFQIAFVAAIPEMVAADQIVAANSRMAASGALTMVVGPILAGWICTRFDPSVAIGVDAVTFAVSALSLYFVRASRAPAQRTDARIGTTLAHSLEGMKFVLGEPVLRAVIVIGLLTSLFGGAIGGAQNLLLYFLKHDLHQSDGIVGLSLGLVGLGGIVGAGFAPLIRRRLGFGPAYLGGLVCKGLFLAALAWSPAARFFWPLLLGFGLAQTAVAIAETALPQQLLPRNLRARGSAAILMLSTLINPVGIACITIAADRLGAAATLRWTGVCAIVIAALGAFTPAATRAPRSVEEV